MGERVLLRGGHVLSMDAEVGELPVGDVLVEDGRIAAVAPEIDADGRRPGGRVRARGDAGLRGHPPAHVAGAVPRRLRRLDARGLLPRHPDHDLAQLLGRRTSTPATTSARSRRSTRASPRSSTSRTATTRRSTPTPRCRVSATPASARCSRYGYFPAPAAEPGFAEHDERLADARRIREQELPGDDGLVTMGVALTEVGLLPFEQTIAEVALGARAGRAHRAAHRLHLGLADHRGDPRARPPRAARPGAGARALQHARRPRLPTGSPTTAARSPRAPRPRSRWAWATR